MTIALLTIDYLARGEWWISVGQIETPDKQGFLFLLGRTGKRWEIDFLWLGLFNVRLT